MQIIEILITLTIVAILATVSIPSYQHYFARERCLATTAALSKLAIAMEHYHIEHQRYDTATIGLLGDGNPFHLQIQIANDHYYLLSAESKECGRITLDSLGESVTS